MAKNKPKTNTNTNTLHDIINSDVLHPALTILALAYADDVQPYLALEVIDTAVIKKRPRGLIYFGDDRDMLMYRADGLPDKHGFYIVKHCYKDGSHKKEATWDEIKAMVESGQPLELVVKKINNYAGTF